MRPIHVSLLASAAAIVVAFAPFACTPADRATVAAVAAVAAPIACDLVPVLDPQAKVAAVLCSDLATVLERALLAAPASAPSPVVRTSTGAHGCRDGLPMVRVDLPGRDPAERVCPEYLADVRRAAGIGHAR